MYSDAERCNRASFAGVMSSKVRDSSDAELPASTCCTPYE